MSEDKRSLVLDREVRTDQDGKRHIKLTCELPDLSGRGTTLGGPPEEKSRS